jgi:hypothetical protein
VAFDRRNGVDKRWPNALVHVQLKVDRSDQKRLVVDQEKADLVNHIPNCEATLSKTIEQGRKNITM